MASTVREQPPWTPPQVHPTAHIPPLKLYNSLTRRKDDFVPIDPAGKTVAWYTCGPTVYDDAHLGHARNYMSTDVLRRIMVDYFGFNVKYVMNITDVDDKIILRGRQQHLLARFKQDQGTAQEDSSVPDSVLAEATAAFRQYVQKNIPLIPPEVAPESYNAEVDKAYGAVLNEQTGGGESPADPKLLMHIRTAKSAAEALVSPGKSSEFYAKTEDILLPYLDTLHGSSIDSKDHAIFTNLTQKFEKRFFEDMRSLNIRDPDVLTRVTEYVPAIVKFIERIVSNGFGYATPDGSVYFDIEAFEKGGHYYAKLEPWSRNDKTLQADGEGSLSKKTTSKRNDNDFALWKASKPGEPSWDSPWGDGRPGWHIECSVMASEVLGKQLDIHSGGVDLRFPHHDNELAQSEAYWSTPTCKLQWSNYFLHAGHLSIQGMKMSKSLKNFTTVRSALTQPEWNARSLRICFLLGAWQDGVEITEELLKSTVSWEGKLNNFFLKGIDVLKNPTKVNGAAQTQSEQDPASGDQKVLDALEKAKADLHTALCDSFNTPVAMRVLSDFVGEFNLAKGLSDDTTLAATRWVTRIVTIFGLDSQGDLKDTDRVGWSGIDIPAAAQPHIYPAAQLRDQVRQIVRSGAVDHPSIAQLAEKSSRPAAAESNGDANPYQRVSEQFRSDVKRLANEQAAGKDILALCDQLRDTHLWNLGIYLEDRDPPLPAVVRQVDRSLLEARAEREQAAEAKRDAKLKREAEEAEKKRQLAEKAKVSHLGMFRTAEFSEWDENGLPVKDAAGAELAKSRKKKLVKEWERQKKIHEEWLGSRVN